MDPFGDVDLCSSVLPLMILLIVGSKMAEGHPAAYRTGKHLATAALLLYALYGWFEYQPVEPVDWLGIALRGLLAAGIVLGVSWIALVVLSFAYRTTIDRPISAVRRWDAAARQRRLEREAMQEADRRQRLAQIEYERSAPHRILANRRDEEIARARADAQSRRDDARFMALLNYRLYAAKTGIDWFPRDEFHHYVAAFMGDNQPPEVVERRGRELIAIFERRLGDIDPPKKRLTLDGLWRWYRDQVALLETSDAPDEIKVHQLALLKERYTELGDRLMEDLEP